MPHALQVAFLLSGVAFLLINAGLLVYLDWRDRTQEPVLTRSLLRPWRKLRERHDGAPPPPPVQAAPLNASAAALLPSRLPQSHPLVPSTEEGEDEDEDEEDEGDEDAPSAPPVAQLRASTGSRLGGAHPLVALAAAMEESAGEPTDAELLTAYTEVDGGGAPITGAMLIGPHYEHDERLLRLPRGLALPTVRNCSAKLRQNATFWVAAFYTGRFEKEAARLRTLGAGLGFCCVPSLVPADSVDGVRESELHFRYRLVALKPLFMLHTLRHSPLPVVYMDVDLEPRSFPHLFAPGAWGTARDVAVFNWQSNISWFGGHRLKAASGVLFLNKTAPAEALLRAWAEVMAHPNNSHSPDDQALDLLANDGGWMQRVAWGWLPEAYLRMP
eukprot:4618719-Prymnesium_polylepis.1